MVIIISGNLKQRSNEGFTLIEILVVVFIVALLAAVVSLKAVNTSALSSKITALRLLNLFELAEQQAITQGDTLAFDVNNQGYQFLVLQVGDSQHQSRWVPLSNNHALQFALLPRKVVINIVTQADQQSSPQIIIFPSGELTPFSINVGVAGKPAQYQVVGYANGTLRLVKI